MLLVAVWTALRRRFPLSRHTSPLEPGEALEVVGEVRQGDLGPGAGYADGAHDQADAMLLGGEHVFHMAADLRPGGVAAADVRRGYR